MSISVREWVLIDEIGRGGMGIVWRARHQMLPGDWAVKVIRPELSQDSESRARFLSEVTVLKRLRHPNIIEVETPFEEGGNLYLPMELLTGKSLEKLLLERPYPWNPHDVVNLARQAAAGLGYAHTQAEPVLHRDVKPGNIHVLDGGHVKILDFGLARTLGDRSMTAAGKAVGTPAYMAPEVLDGKRASTRSDVYALGVVMYRMLTGRLPYDLPEDESSLVALVLSIVRAHDRGLPDIREFAPAVPPQLAAAVMNTLSRDPALRPADGMELSASLSRRDLLSSQAGDGQAGLDSTRLGIELPATGRAAQPPASPAGVPITPPEVFGRPIGSHVPAQRDADVSLLGIRVTAGDSGVKSEPDTDRFAEKSDFVPVVPQVVHAKPPRGRKIWPWIVLGVVGIAIGAGFGLFGIGSGESGPLSSSGLLSGGEPLEKVQFSMHIMSQCPFGAQVQKGIAPVLKTLGKAVDFKMYYIGDEPEPGNLTSMHGADEVMGDKLQLCAMEYAPANYMDVVVCMANDMRNIPQNFEKCATEAGIDPAPIKACAEGQEGADLLSASFKASKEVGARGSPTMFLNGEKYQGGRTETDFMRSICNAFKAEKPSVCANIPEPKKVAVTVLSDRRCTKCFPDRILGQLKNMFPGLEPKTLDYSDPEGRALYDSLKDQGVKLLPAFLFDPVVVDDAGFSQIKRFVVDAGQYKLLQVGAKFDPTAEICDNGVDDDGDGRVDCRDSDCEGSSECRSEIARRLDLFVMSQCPFGVKALNALPEFIDAFKYDGISVNINYIADEMPDGSFKALHGQPEVDENIRQLCAINYYPKDYKYLEYIVCRNKDIRSSDWKRCAMNGIDPDVIRRCADGSEGRRLLSKNLKFARQLEIGASPTWLANNKFKFSGIAPEQIKKQFCDHNSNLSGCRKTLSGEAIGGGTGASSSGSN